MRTEPEVMEYDSLEDLEDTIDQVYERAERLETEMHELLRQLGAFMDYRHEPEKFREAAEYVSSHIPDETLPGIAQRYAAEQLDDPEQADNWDLLEEAVEKTEHLSEQWRTAYTNLWAEFGYTDEKLADEIEGLPPFQHFLNTWEEAPYHLFEEQESYDDWRESTEAKGSNPTMARYFDIPNPNGKQTDDLFRQEDLETEDEREEHGRTFEEDPEFWREKLNGRPEDSRWVDQSKVDRSRAV